MSGKAKLAESGSGDEVAATPLAAPDLAAFAALLDEFAPFGPAPLVPEVSVFQGRGLLELWGAAERLAGRSLSAPFWGYPWPGGISLARTLLDDPRLVRGARVLDLGVGGGVSALASALAGARLVTANDQDPWALATSSIAAERQGISLDLLLADLALAGEVSSASNAGQLDGTDHPDHSGHTNQNRYNATRGPASAAGAELGWASAPGAGDVVLAGDLSYERGVAPRIRGFLDRAQERGALVLAADAGRAYFDPTGFTLLAEYQVPVPRDLEGATERVARVYRLD